MFATSGMTSPAAHGGTAGAALWDVLRKEARPSTHCFWCLALRLMPACCRRHGS
jgi:hypothetical protein